MMGSRGYRGGDECDAFFRRSRRILFWKPGELRTIKRGYWKRPRKTAHHEVSHTGVVAIVRGPEGM
jgi:hypothetical protein